MDGAGATTYETPMFMRFNIKLHLHLCLLVTRQRIQSTLIAVDRYLRLVEDKTIPD